MDSKRYKILNRIIVLLGTVLRTIYVFVTPVLQGNQYDLGSVDAAQNIYTGHLGYIYYLFTYKRLPGFDPREVYQFFHPPLHHSIEATWLGVVNLFTKDLVAQIEWLQIPTLIYSILALVFFYLFLKELGVKEEKQWIALAVISLHPILIYMAGSLNNDGLSVMFQFAAVWLTAKWFNDRKLTSIIGIALAIGLGMLSKLSASLIAIPVAFVFVYVFVAECSKERRIPASLFIQYCVFGLICIPLGMSWAVRCKIRFGMPLAYVNKLPEDSWQYIGNYSLWERFGIPSPIRLIGNLTHGGIGFGENMWVQLFRTAALGEMDLSGLSMLRKILAMALILICGIVAVLGFVAFIRFCIKSSFIAAMKWFLIILYVVQLVSFVRFCYGYPHQCTLNFRYMIPILITQAVALAEFPTLFQREKINDEL